MQLTAKLLTVLPLQTGSGKNGDWKKQDFIVETGEMYPKKICISVWGDKINPTVLVVGNELNIDFDIESREYNGRWYTDLKAWKIELVNAVQETTRTTTEGTNPPEEIDSNEVAPF
jgi:hypothetical protein